MVMAMNVKTIMRICLVVMSLLSLQAQAALKAHVDRNPVAVDESLILTIESDRNLDGSPDFNILRKDFEVFSPSNSTSMQIINGSVMRSLTWRVNLIPKRAGAILIPAFEVDGEKSNPITLQVESSSTPKSTQSGTDLFMSVSVDSDEAYVQQQIVLTVQFYRAVNVAGRQLSDPQISGVETVVEKLGDDREYQKTIDGRLFAVFERKYVIFPQQSGTMKIAPMNFDVDVLARGNNRFDPFGRNTVRKRVRSEAITMDIKAIPAGIVGNWLPARELKLLEEWSSEEFMVGEPVTRTVTLLASGLSAAQLPEIDMNTPVGVKVYPDQPITEDRKDSNGAIGIRQQKLAIIPTKTGTLTLPEMQLTWWNTAKQKLETAKLPAKTVTVVAAQQEVPLQPSPMQVPTESGEAVSITGDDAQSAVGASQTATSAGWWPWLSLVLGLAWLVTLIAWWRKGVVKDKPNSKTAAEKQQSMRTLEKQLKAACFKNDAANAKQMLLAWAKQNWVNNAPTSLTAMARMCDEPLATELVGLDVVLYSNQSAEWKGEGLWQSFAKSKPVPQILNSNTESTLQPLFPG